MRLQVYICWMVISEGERAKKRRARRWGKKKGQSVGGNDDAISRKNDDSIRRQKDNPVSR